MVKQEEGCKAVLARPNILLAGVGLSDSSNSAGHWNSLDEAKKALTTLPEQPTAKDIDEWANRWGQTLWRHFRAAGQHPDDDVLSELLLITEVSGEPYFARVTVRWDGSKFHTLLPSLTVDRSHPYAEYSGACRQFVTHAGDHGDLITSPIRNLYEFTAMDGIGRKMKGAKDTEELAAAALELEKMLTLIDDRLEPGHPVIAPPYALARWDQKTHSWQVKLNDACLRAASAQ